jgi:hypothetical protein
VASVANHRAVEPTTSGVSAETTALVLHGTSPPRGAGNGGLEDEARMLRNSLDHDFLLGAAAAANTEASLHDMNLDVDALEALLGQVQARDATPEQVELLLKGFLERTRERRQNGWNNLNHFRSQREAMRRVIWEEFSKEGRQPPNFARDPPRPGGR